MVTLGCVPRPSSGPDDLHFSRNAGRNYLVFCFHTARRAGYPPYELRALRKEHEGAE